MANEEKGKQNNNNLIYQLIIVIGLIVYIPYSYTLYNHIFEDDKVVVVEVVDTKLVTCISTKFDNGEFSTTNQRALSSFDGDVWNHRYSSSTVIWVSDSLTVVIFEHDMYDSNEGGYVTYQNIHVGFDDHLVEISDVENDRIVEIVTAHTEMIKQIEIDIQTEKQTKLRERIKSICQ